MIYIELIDIVDKNGNFTGQVMEREEAHNKNLLHNEISVYIINDKKEVLLQKRSPNKRFYPNKWGLCSGHVLSGESLKLAALREIEEEVGLKVSYSDLVQFGAKLINIKDTNSSIKYSFYIKRNLNIEDLIIQKEELTELKWYKIDDIIAMVKHKDNSITIKEDRLYLLNLLKENLK